MSTFVPTSTRLGCVLYHCLVGQPPFQDRNLVKLMLKHAKEPPPPVRDINPAIPEGLQHMVNWMLAKEPSKRFPSPERAAASLQTYLAAPEVLPALDAEPRMAAYLQWLDAEDPSPAMPAPLLAAPAPSRPPSQVPSGDSASAGVELVKAGSGPAEPKKNYLALGIAIGIGGVLLLVLLGALISRLLKP